MRYQTGSGRIASPNNSLTSGLSLRFWRICCVMELVNLSWLFAYFMNATQAATPNVPRITNAGHLRYQAVNAIRQNRQLTPGYDGRNQNWRGRRDSPRRRAVLVSIRVERSTDEVLRAKRRFQRGVARLGPVGTVVEPKALLSRRASPGSTYVSALEFSP